MKWPGRGTRWAIFRLTLVTEKHEVSAMKTKTALDDPSPEDLRHPKPGVIDQRQQRIDPANKHTVDQNDRPESNTKQPGELGDDESD